MSKDPAKQVDKLKAELAQVKSENRDLKKQIESKRFRAAWELATYFNRLFPPNSIRRKTLVASGKKVSNIHAGRRIRRNKKYQTIITGLAANKPIIIYDSIPWDVDLKQRPHHLALQLSQAGCFVIYLERMGSKPFRVIGPGIVSINELSALANIALKNKVFFFVSSTNARREVYDTAKEIFHNKLQLIYEYIDEINEDISPMTHELQSFYDLLSEYKPVLMIASSKKLQQDLIDDGFSKNNILLSENAVNIDDFDYTKIIPKKPVDLIGVIKSKKPIVGYYGALAPWLDAKLMNNLAKKRQDLEFVYIGPDYSDGLKAFEKYPNTHFLGSKEYAQLPNYALYFDCAIIPFQLGEIAKATSPVKLFEYMAMGLPTIGTHDLDELRGYKFVYVSDKARDFESNVDRAIKDKQNDSARQLLLKQAKQNTWEQRAKHIVKVINKKGHTK